MALQSSAQERMTEKAQQYIKQLRFSEAQALLEKAIKKQPENATYHEQLGFAYRKTNKYLSAEEQYAIADSIGGLSSEGRVHYSQMLLKNGKIEQSNEQIKLFLATEPENFVIAQMIQSIDKLSVWQKEPVAFKLHTLEGVNTIHSEFGPVVFNDLLLFSSSRGEDLVNNNGGSFNDEGYLTIYQAPITDINLRKTKNPKTFSGKFTGDFHLGPISMSPDQKTIYYSKVESGMKKGKTHFIQSYRADLIQEKKVKNERPMSFNTDSASSGHVAISPGGNLICFASDRSGGKGKMDLYIIEKTDSNWSKPKAVSSVNTELNEVFPYFLNDSTLFFSSDGLPGYGGLDIYQSFKSGGEWGEPINLKAPLNSSKDDFSIYYENPSKGFFASDREGGIGKDDIYQFTQLAPPAENTRTEIAGIFEYNNLPASGVTLKLLNEDDNEMMVVMTDTNGFFSFGELPINESYRIEVVDQDEGYIANSNIYLTNEYGEKVMILDQEAGSLFSFKSLTKEHIASLDKLEEVDSEMDSYNVFGQIFSKLGIDTYEGLKLEILDDEGNFIQNVFVSKEGYYEIKNLSKTKFYKIQIAGADADDYSGTIYYDDGYSVKSFQNNSSSLFNFEKMVVTAESETSTLCKLLLADKGKGKSGIATRLFSKQMKNLGGAVTDENGVVSFDVLNPTEPYYLIISDSNRRDSNSNITTYIVDENLNRVRTATKSSDYKFEFNTLPPKLFLSNILDAPYRLYGQVFFNRRGDFVETITITARNSDEEIAERVQTKKAGFFEFNALNPDEEYAFSLDKKFKQDLFVYFFDENNEVIDSLLFSDLSKYVYEKLKLEEAQRLAKLRATDYKTENQFVADLVAGQIFKKLPGDYVQGIKVYAIDDQGNKIDSAYTDGRGNFKFSQLKRDENFKLQILDEQDGELNIAFLNFNGHFEGSAKTDADKSFTYNKIILEAASDLGMSNSENPQITPVFGQLFTTLKGDYPSGAKVFAYDKDGRLIDIAIVDEKGMFKFSKLERDESYSFRTDDRSTEFGINILDKSGNLIDRIEASNFVYEYKVLDRSETKIDKIKLSDGSHFDVNSFLSDDLVNLKSDGNTIYYNYKTYKLSKDDIRVLDEFVEKMNADSTLVIDIQSHTDPSERTSQRSYSALRSVSIANYVFSKGIALERIEITNWEEEKLVVNCPLVSDCSAEDRLRNMRAELSLNSKEDLLKTPGFVVYFSFDQWTLSEQGNQEMFQALKNNKMKEAREVFLDGYTDVWGGYEMNERIAYLRVYNIKNILEREGVDPGIITTDVHGESRPIGRCKLQYPCSIIDRQQNRRVEIRITP